MIHSYQELTKFLNLCYRLIPNENPVAKFVVIAIIILIRWALHKTIGPFVIDNLHNVNVSELKYVSNCDKSIDIAVCSSPTNLKVTFLEYSSLFFTINNAKQRESSTG